MHLHITHATCYDYVPAVAMAQHMAYLKPPTTTHQQLLGHSLLVTPEPAQAQDTQDVFGNTRHYFALQTPHNQLTVIARSLVATRPASYPASAMAWEAVRARFQFHAQTHAQDHTQPPFDAAVEFVYASPFAPHHADFADYACHSFTPGTPLLWAARDLMQRIHRDFTYESQSTEVNTPALQALAQRKGVCQDFAHIMIACLRAMGLPARYVSGYLLTQPLPGQPRLVGSDASHAWVSVYLPDLTDLANLTDLTNPSGATRWWDFDPTNNRDGCGTPGEDYVTLALGRDYADVSPIRGVIRGGTHHSLTVGVTVQDQSQSPVLPPGPLPSAP